MRILIVDDEPAILALLTDFLADEGHVVTGTRNGREALESARRACPDLVLSMYGRAKFDLLRQRLLYPQ